MIRNPPQDKMLLEYNIPIWDFEEYFLDRHDYFFDSHHMNKYGKSAFTTILKNKIINEFSENKILLLLLAYNETKFIHNY